MAVVVWGRTTRTREGGEEEEEGEERDGAALKRRARGYPRDGLAREDDEDETPRRAGVGNERRGRTEKRRRATRL